MFSGCDGRKADLSFLALSFIVGSTHLHNGALLELPSRNQTPLSGSVLQGMAGTSASEVLSKYH